MPGAPYADLYAQVWDLYHGGEQQKARELFGKLLLMINVDAQIPGARQYVMKRRGVFKTTASRQLDVKLSPEAIQEIEFNFRSTQAVSEGLDLKEEAQMRTSSRQSAAGVSRRDLFRTGGLIAAGAVRAEAAPGANSKITDPEVYNRIGVRPFINCTATYTINGGSQMLPEVISTVAQAAYYHVNIDELMGKVGDRLAELLQVGWGIVTAGAAAALTHATAGCLAGTDPEKIQRLPNLSLNNAWERASTQMDETFEAPQTEEQAKCAAADGQ